MRLKKKKLGIVPQLRPKSIISVLICPKTDFPEFHISLAEIHTHSHTHAHTHTHTHTLKEKMFYPIVKNFVSIDQTFKFSYQHYHIHSFISPILGFVLRFDACELSPLSLFLVSFFF